MKRRKNNVIVYEYTMKFRCTVRIQTEPLHVNVSPQKMQLYPFPVWFFCCKLNRKIKGNKSQHRPINQSVNSSYILLFHLLSTWFPQYFTPSFLMVFFPLQLAVMPWGRVSSSWLHPSHHISIWGLEQISMANPCGRLALCRRSQPLAPAL